MCTVCSSEVAVVSGKVSDLTVSRILASEDGKVSDFCLQNTNHALNDFAIREKVVPISMPSDLHYTHLN